MQNLTVLYIEYVDRELLHTSAKQSNQLSETVHLFTYLFSLRHNLVPWT